MPATNLEFHPEAEADAQGARQWYQQRSAIAARAFLSELTRSVESIVEVLQLYPAYLAGTRRYVFRKFPFNLIYRIDGDSIIVVAIAHHRRKPGYWLERH